MNQSEKDVTEQQHVLVIGAAGLDIVGRPSTLPDPGSSVPAVMRPSFGGVARNVAENLARLGQPVKLVTVVGKDGFGDQLLAHTASAGVDVSACLKSAEFATASYLAILTEENRLYFALDDMRILTQLKPAYLRQQERLFHNACMIFLDANLPPATLRVIFNLAQQHHVPVCADATSDTLAPRLLPFLSKLLILNANPNETSILAKIPAFEAEDIQTVQLSARKLISLGAEIAIIPISEHGVCYASSETSGHIPAIHTTIFDPTGAGDALTATILFGLINEIPLDESIRLGVSAATLTLRHAGTVYPDLNLELLYDQMVF